MKQFQIQISIVRWHVIWLEIEYKMDRMYTVHYMTVEMAYFVNMEMKSSKKIRRINELNSKISQIYHICYDTNPFIRQTKSTNLW